MVHHRSIKDLLVFMALIPVFIVVAKVSSLEKAFISIVTSYLFYVLLSEKWEMRKRLWFWAMIVIFAGAHLLVIYFVRFDYRISPALVCLPIAIADFFVMYYLVNKLERFDKIRDYNVESS
jgi:hypothetical protein